MITGMLKKYLRFFAIKRYLKKSRIKKLNIGCGSKPLNGWLNTDIKTEYGDIFQDASKKFPFKDFQFNYIFCEHFLEHIPYKKGIFFLSECYRTLKKGGVLRISTPDLRLLVKTYLGKNPYVKSKEVIARHKRITKKRCDSLCNLLNDKMRCWGHKFVYDEDLLAKSLKNTGFKNIRKCEFGKSQHKHLQGIERHADVEWMKKAEPMIFECER